MGAEFLQDCLVRDGRIARDTESPAAAPGSPLSLTSVVPSSSRRCPPGAHPPPSLRDGVAECSMVLTVTFRWSLEDGINSLPLRVRSEAGHQAQSISSLVYCGVSACFVDFLEIRARHDMGLPIDHNLVLITRIALMKLARA